MLRPRRTPSKSIRFALTAGAVLGLVSSPSTAQAAKKVKCDASAGWSALAGRPASYVAGAPTGLYIWQEKGVWRVGATNNTGGPTTFSAQISTDAPLSGKPVGIEGKSDIVEVKSQMVKFRFANFGGLDGVAIESPCTNSITIQGEVNGQPLTNGQVFLGAAGSNPAVVPVVLTRTATTVPATQALAKSASVTVTQAPTTAAPVAAAAVGTPTVAVSVPASTAAPTCSAGGWAPAFVGRPPARKAVAGMSVWIQGGNLRLQFDSDVSRLFEGRVTATTNVAAKGFGIERKDQISVSGNQVNFSLRVGKAGDGFEVVAPCSTTFIVEGTVDGVPMAPAQVSIGAGGVAASAMPLVLARS